MSLAIGKRHISLAGKWFNHSPPPPPSYYSSYLWPKKIKIKIKNLPLSNSAGQKTPIKFIRSIAQGICQNTDWNKTFPYSVLHLIWHHPFLLPEYLSHLQQNPKVGGSHFSYNQPGGWKLSALVLCKDTPFTLTWGDWGGRKEERKKKRSQRSNFTDPKTTMTIKTAIILVLQDKSLLKYKKQSIHMAFQTDLSNLMNQKSSQHKENTDSGKPCH